jgi:hypothetical protein
MNSPEPRPLQPPAELEARVVARLRAAGLLASAHHRQETAMKTVHARWSVAATVLVAAALWAGTRLAPAADTPSGDPPAAAAVPADARPAFALMLYEDAGYQAPVDEAAHAARVAEYSAWAGQLAAQGQLVDGAELLAEGVLLHRERPRADGVPDSTLGTLAGYFVIRADSLAEAERVAADCPHLAYGGTVSVRPTGA